MGNEVLEYVFITSRCSMEHWQEIGRTVTSVIQVTISTVAVETAWCTTLMTVCTSLDGTSDEHFPNLRGFSVAEGAVRCQWSRRSSETHATYLPPGDCAVTMQSCIAAINVARIHPERNMAVILDG